MIVSCDMKKNFIEEQHLLMSAAIAAANAAEHSAKRVETLSHLYAVSDRTGDADELFEEIRSERIRETELRKSAITLYSEVSENYESTCRNIDANEEKDPDA
jgi:hypothetical protein